MSTFCNDEPEGAVGPTEDGRDPKDQEQGFGGSYIRRNGLRRGSEGFYGNSVNSAFPTISFKPANYSGTGGLNEMGNRAADLSDLSLSSSLPRQNDYFNLAYGNVAADAEIRDMGLGLASDLEGSRQRIFDPLEADIVQEARDYDSPYRMNQQMGQADAAVVQAYDKASRTGDRNQLRMGVNPNSGKAMAARENLNFDRSMASATAANRAADNLKTKGFGMRMAAAGLGKDKAGQQISAMGSSIAAGQGAINSFDRAMDSNRGVFAGAGAGLNTAVSAYGNSGRLAMDKEQNDNQREDRSDAFTGQLIGAGLGYLSGGSTGGGCGGKP